MRAFWALHRWGVRGRESARQLARAARAGALGLGDRVECPCCSRTFWRFLPPSEECPSCGSHERHRLLWFYLFEHSPALLARASSLLHFAPEPVFEARFRRMPGLRYATVDLNPKRADVAADIAALPFADGSFDVLLCSHVLEHVEDDRRGLAEMNRVLRPGGTALLLVPTDRSRAKTLEDPSITSPEGRERAFGQHDHVRLYGRDFPERVRAAGLEVAVDRLDEQLDPALLRRRQMKSGLWVCRKPARGAAG